MSGFIGWLEDLNAKDTKVRAVLRRASLLTRAYLLPPIPTSNPL